MVLAPRALGPGKVSFTQHAGASGSASSKLVFEDPDSGSGRPEARNRELGVGLNPMISVEAIAYMNASMLVSRLQ